MKRIINYLCILFIVFFIKTINVQASNTLTCIYSVNNLNDVNYIALVQDNYEQIGLFISKDNSTYVSAINKRWSIENYSESMQVSSSGNPYFNNCPSYAYLDEELNAFYLFNNKKDQSKCPVYDNTTKKCLYQDLIEHSSIIKSSFDNLTYLTSIEVYNSSNDKIYYAKGLKPVTIKPEIEEKEEPIKNPTFSNTKWDSLCTEEAGVKNAVRIAGYVVQICRWVAPFLIMVLGMIDLFKAVVKADDKAMGGAVRSLITKIILGLVIFFIPTMVLALISALGNTFNGMEKEDNQTFGACTKCLFDPFNCK